jgi:hypothetical protein
VAVLPASVLATMSTAPVSWWIPPPWLAALLPETVERMRVMAPEL